jgi:sulfane dehydrogenase subunit SoxC
MTDMQKPPASDIEEQDRWRPTPLEALDREEIPSEIHFVRDHFPAPAAGLAPWSLKLTASSPGSDQLTSAELDLERLRSLPQRTLTVVLECAGHRRAEFEPMPPGLPWAVGAVAEAIWTGPSLATALELIGVPAAAREVVLEGADSGHIDEVPGIHHFARSLPLAKALDPDILLALEMNGGPIPVDRGGPVRAIVPGWYATDSVKWLRRIWFTDDEFDGYFQAQDYRFLAPGEPGPGRRMSDLPVHALITTTATTAAGEVSVRGVAWGGTGGVAEVLVCVDDGSWARARLDPARGPYTRVGWRAQIKVTPGRHELACRAIDAAGQTQPDRPPPNAQGYGNNAIHRVSIAAT